MRAQKSRLIKKSHSKYKLLNREMPLKKNYGSVCTGFSVSIPRAAEKQFIPIAAEPIADCIAAFFFSHINGDRCHHQFNSKTCKTIFHQ